MEMPAQAPRPSQGQRSRPQRPPSPQSRSRPGRPPPPTAVQEITDVGALQQCHDEAYKYINQGLTADEQGKADEAKAFYEGGLREVNKVLAVNCECLNGTDEQKDTGKEIQQKMNKTKLQIEYRLQSLKETQRVAPSAPEAMVVDEPPTYEDATSGPNSMVDAEYVALGDSIMTQDSVDHSSMVANATEIFAIPDGVQMFFITPEGYVSAPSYPTALKIFKFNDSHVQSASEEQPPAFLQMGDWYYPLLPGASPVLQTNYGAYLFPDVTATTQGSSVGVMMPETVSPAQRQRFEQMLRSLTMMQQQEATPREATQREVTPREATRTGEVTGEETRHREPAGAEGGEEETTSTKISKGLITAAGYISWGVGKGAEKAGQLIKYGSTSLRTRLQPEENPKQIDPKVQKGIEYVRVGSHCAVKVSSFIVSKLGQATMALAREAAPHIRKQGEKVLPKSLKPSSEEGKSKVDSVIEVAASGLQGFGTVYMSLENAAKALGKNLANETVNVVGHKYGNEAGQLTEHTLYSAGNIAMTAYNANHLGVKAIAKRAAKDAGKAVLEDLKDKNKPTRPPPVNNGAGPSSSGKQQFN